MKGIMLKDEQTERGEVRERAVNKESGPKKRKGKEKIDCVSELVVLKRSQTLRPSPQPHLHKLQRLPLPSPASGPAINTFSITSSGEQKKRKSRRRRGRGRPLGEVSVNPLDDTSGHEAQMCFRKGPAIVPWHTRAV